MIATGIPLKKNKRLRIQGNLDDKLINETNKKYVLMKGVYLYIRTYVPRFLPPEM